MYERFDIGLKFKYIVLFTLPNIIDVLKKKVLTTYYIYLRVRLIYFVFNSLIIRTICYAYDYIVVLYEHHQLCPIFLMVKF